jgi:hypothetical protein
VETYAGGNLAQLGSIMVGRLFLGRGGASQSLV